MRRVWGTLLTDGQSGRTMGCGEPCGVGWRPVYDCSSIVLEFGSSVVAVELR
jgi:hypothetical protein